MTVEGILCANFLFGEWYPMVYAVAALDIVEFAEKSVSKAVTYKLFVTLPIVVWIKKLVAVIDPCSFDAMTDGKINGNFNNVFSCYHCASWMRKLAFVVYDEVVIYILKIATLCRHKANILFLCSVS